MFESKNAASMYPNVGSEVKTTINTCRTPGRHRPVLDDIGTSYTPSCGQRSIRTPPIGEYGRISSRQHFPPLTSRDVLVKTSLLEREPQGQGRVRYDALSRKSIPIPHLLDDWTDEDKFTRRHPTYWEEQVKKNVPRRPTFVLASDPSPVTLTGWEMTDDFINDTKGVFYRSDTMHREKSYVVNPEWASEAKHLTNGPKAYRTCAIRYGWCS